MNRDVVHVVGEPPSETGMVEQWTTPFAVDAFFLSPECYMYDTRM